MNRIIIAGAGLLETIDKEIVDILTNDNSAIVIEYSGALSADELRRHIKAIFANKNIPERTLLFDGAPISPEMIEAIRENIPVRPPMPPLEIKAIPLRPTTVALKPDLNRGHWLKNTRKRR